MGGIGSGSSFFSNSVVEDCLKLDVNKLVKLGILGPYISARGSLEWTDVYTGALIIRKEFREAIKGPTKLSELKN